MKEKQIVPSISLSWRGLHIGTRPQAKAESLHVEVIKSPFPLVASDEQLAQNLISGDPEALSLIYDRYAASLYRVLNALLSSPSDAEDALQEVFVALATGKTARIRDLRSYLFTAARNQAFSILRQRKKEPEWHNVSELEIAEPPSAEPVQDWTQLLSRLPIEQREVIVLKVWEQMTFAEIAQVMRTSPNTAMSRYRYGIERLRVWCKEEENYA